jgi:hypothetical protein
VIEVPPASVTSLPVDNATPHALLPATYTPQHTWADIAWRTMDGAGSLFGIFWKLLKLLICIGLDIFDFTFGRILGFGIAVDVGSALIAMALWGMGWRSLWSVPELFDLTEQVDGFLPSCTFIALAGWRNN